MITLTYGNRQHFRIHHDDVNILGRSGAGLPVKRSEYRLNDGPAVHFYVEPETPKGQGPYPYPYDAKTPSVYRLAEQPGHFNIEISIQCPQLRKGWNSLFIAVEGKTGEIEELKTEFHWDPSTVSLPLDLRDLSPYKHIQEIGQVVNGAFDIDPEKNLIRSRPPVTTDVLLLLGSPAGSQEATYDVRFTERGKNAIFLGLSDFFARHEEQTQGLGIKPGYTTAGLVTIRPEGWVETWIMSEDLLVDKETAWEVKSIYPGHVRIQPDVTYHVRHQVIMHEGCNYVRFKMWPAGKPEPKKWLMEDNNAHLDPGLPKIPQASFGLVQFWGSPTEWSNIRVQALDVDVNTLARRRRKGYLIRAYRTAVDLLTRALRPFHSPGKLRPRPPGVVSRK